MKQVVRFERKFLLPYEDYCRYRSRLWSTLERDSHTGEHGYLVRSLYFDTLEDKDFFEKIDGVEERRKIRLRIYRPQDQVAWLEMKQKQGNYQWKRSFKVSREDAQALAQGKYGALLAYDDDFTTECYALMNMQCYRPKAIVEYQREAFVVPGNNTRVTFDRELRATESNFDLFAEHLNTYPVQDPYQVVLEVKFNGFLFEYIKDLVSQCNQKEVSASKYCLSRIASQKITS